MIKNIQYKKLGEICDFISGGTPSKSKNEYWKNGNIPWIKISDFKEKYIKYSDEKITKNGLENSSAKLLKKGTILYTIFASVGKVAILDIEATTNQAIVGVNLKENNLVDKDFLYYFLCSIENNIKRQARGVAQNNINISILKNVCIPILPISSQKNIVKTLMRLENILENFKQKKILINFLNKSLFTTMFGDIKTNDKNWEIYYWKDILNIKNGKNQKQVEDINGKYPIYGSGGIIGRSNAYICNENSIIIGRKGNINKPILVKEKFWNVDTAFGLEVKSEKMSYHYLYYFCLFYDFEIHNKAVTIPSLVKSDLEKIVLPVPPIELQNKFAERIEKITKLSFNLY
ncbi:MAG: restriction endonuclease subunit S [Fusobacterium periodonticum]|nr:restriction endonuclease subunit S [Fusobacterium periodonticum]